MPRSLLLEGILSEDPKATRAQVWAFDHATVVGEVGRGLGRLIDAAQRKLPLVKPFAEIVSGQLSRLAPSDAFRHARDDNLILPIEPDHCRSALDAVGAARERCWKFDWVIDLDIKSFFDTIPHDLIEKAVARHTELGWVRLYVKRWLRAPVERADGTCMERTQGTPQGSVVSPLLANLFLHYAFDLWMQRTFPHLCFERYADDAIVHCRSESQARSVLEAIRQRLAECGLELHSEKTRIVYCKGCHSQAMS